eukprot:m.246154 g.246154  ORF g.246154 m.246154 type:complete len:245 (+) comp14922_c0_seq1:2-736(+)
MLDGFTRLQLQQALDGGYLTEIQQQAAHVRLKELQGVSEQPVQPQQPDGPVDQRRSRPKVSAVPASDTPVKAVTKRLVNESNGQEPAPKMPRKNPSSAKRTARTSNKLEDVNARDKKSGQTPLREAVQDEDVHRVRELIKRGADVNLGDFAGWSPLHEAKKSLIASILLQANADINTQSLVNGATPLHEAAHYDNLEVVRLLLAHGAATDIKNHKGQTALDVAGDLARAILEEHGRNAAGPMAI